MEEHDVFISYAHRDNKPILENDSDKGWVSNFDEILRNFLTRELGRDVRVWRDPSNGTGDYFWDNIKGNLLKSKAFILILSPSYVNSEYCRKEFDTFLRERKIVRVGDRSCVFPIVKNPVDTGGLPLSLQGFLKEVLFTEFYKREENEKILTLDVEYGDESKRELLKKIDFLAQDIFLLLKDAGKETAGSTEIVEQTALKPFQGTTIYMAEPTPDLWDEYLKIRRDFIKRGANVLPSSFDFSRPEAIEDYKTSMLSDLKQCKLIVHFIGSEDAGYSDENRQPFVQMQMNIAAEYQAGASCKRLIWLPQEVEPSDEAHRQFTGQLSAATSRDVDLLRTPLDLRTEMERILLDKPKPQAPPVEASVKPTIYVLHDNQDAEPVAQIVDKLFENGCEVWTVSQTGGDLIEEHKWYLLNCDAALVYWNNAPTFRVRAMMSEFQRIMDNGREQAFRAKGVLIDGGSPEKDNFKSHETLVRSDEDLGAFLANLKSGGQA